MAKPADVAATCVTKRRLEIRAIVISPIGLTDKHPDDTPVVGLCLVKETRNAA
jgi:hypothetical protein